MNTYRAKLLALADWDEGAHPRDETGKFAGGSGSGGASPTSESVPGGGKSSPGAAYFDRNPRLEPFRAIPVVRSEGTGTRHPEAEVAGGKIHLYPKFDELTPAVQDFVFAHEVGHAVLDEKGLAALVPDAEALGIDVWDTDKLPFGQNNMHEAFADSFASYHTDKEVVKRYPAWAKLVEKYAERKKDLSYRARLGLLLDWDESQHPRDEAGRFGGGDGAPSGNGGSEKALPHAAAVTSNDTTGRHTVSLPGGKGDIDLIDPAQAAANAEARGDSPEVVADWKAIPKDHLYVDTVAVAVPRQGSGTKLYESAAAFAVSRGMKGLASSRSGRNEASNALWKALERRGTVTQVGKYDVVTLAYRERLVFLLDKDEHGYGSYPRGEGPGRSGAVSVGGREVSVVLPERAKRAGDVLVSVDIDKFDDEFKREPGFYIEPGGKGGIGERYGRFGEFVSKADSIEAPEVSVRPDGRVGFTNGRHRYAYLRDQGVKALPVAMTKASAKLAKKHGYALCSYREYMALLLDWDEGAHPRDETGKFAAGGGGLTGSLASERLTHEVTASGDRLFISSKLKPEQENWLDQADPIKERVAATVDLNPATKSAYLNRMDSRTRGKGYGPETMRAVLDHLRSKGYETAEGYVERDNFASQSMMTKLGAVIDKEKRGKDGDYWRITLSAPLSYRDKLVALDWDESAHPRDDAGRFGEGGSGAASGGASEAFKEEPPTKPGKGASKAEKKAYDVARDAYYQRLAGEGRRVLEKELGAKAARVEERIQAGLNTSPRDGVGPHVETLKNDRLGKVPDVLYRGTKPGKFEDSPDTEAGVGELGGGIYVTGDKEHAANYANWDPDNVVHTIEWTEKPTAKETGFIEAVGGDTHDQRLIDGNGHEVWRDRMTIANVRDHRAALKEVAKRSGMKVLVGLTGSQGQDQISILDRTAVKGTAREPAGTPKKLSYREALALLLDFDESKVQRDEAGRFSGDGSSSGGEKGSSARDAPWAKDLPSLAKPEGTISGEITDKRGTTYAVVVNDRLYPGNPVPKKEFSVYDTKTGASVASAELRREQKAVSSVHVRSEVQRRGIATELYKHIEEHLGHELKPNPALTTEGEAFWESRAKKLSVRASDYRSKLALLLEWDESQHPRDEAGRFGEAGGGERSHSDKELTDKTQAMKVMNALVNRSYSDESSTVDLSTLSVADRLAALKAASDPANQLYFRNDRYQGSSKVYDTFQDEARKAGWSPERVLQEAKDRGLVSDQRGDPKQPGTFSYDVGTNVLFGDTLWKNVPEESRSALASGYTKALIGEEHAVAAPDPSALRESGWSTTELESFADTLEAAGGSGSNWYRSSEEDGPHTYWALDSVAGSFALYSKDYGNFESHVVAGWALSSGTSTAHVLREMGAEAFPHPDGEFYQPARPEYAGRVETYSPRAVENLRTMKANTEQWFRDNLKGKRGEDPDAKLDRPIELQRGIGGHVDAYTPASAESWTTDKRTVDRFGDMMSGRAEGAYSALKTTVTYRDVLWSHQTMAGRPGWPADKELKGKKEYVVLGRAVKDVAVDRRYTKQGEKLRVDRAARDERARARDEWMARRDAERASRGE